MEANCMPETGRCDACDKEIINPDIIYLCFVEIQSLFCMDCFRSSQNVFFDLPKLANIEDKYSEEYKNIIEKHSAIPVKTRDLVLQMLYSHNGGKIPSYYTEDERLHRIRCVKELERQILSVTGFIPFVAETIL